MIHTSLKNIEHALETPGLLLNDKNENAPQGQA